MVDLNVVYIGATSPGQEPSDDPLVKRLAPRECTQLDLGMEESELLNDVRMIIDDANSSSCKVVVVLNAFLDPMHESVDENRRWNPSDTRLRKLLDTDPEPRQQLKGIDERPLKSLDLMWKLWTLTRTQAPLLVTTDGVKISRQARSTLELAFSSGRVCQLYAWQDRDEDLCDVIDAMDL